MSDATLDKIRAAVGSSGYLERSEDTDPYLKDFRGLFRGRAALVVLPGSTSEVSAVLALCHEHRIGVVPHGGNTSYCGGATPDASGTQIVLSLRRLSRVRNVDTRNWSMVVEAGCILADVQRAADQVDRLFPLSLGSEGTCQIGGNLS